MALSLYDIVHIEDDTELLMSKVAELIATGKTAEEATAMVLASIGQLEHDKVIAYGIRIKNWSAEAEAIKAEENALAKRRKSLESKIKFLEINLVGCLPHEKGRKWSDPRCVVSLKPSEYVLITEIDKIPNEYWRQPATPPKEVNKDALWDAFKVEKKVEGARLETNWKAVIK